MNGANDFDVLIGGGGLVGSALAWALSQNPALRIALVEPDAVLAEKSPASYDDRSVALAYGTRLLFEQLSLWPLIEPVSTAIQRIHISERGRFGATRINADEEGVPSLGYVIENRQLGHALTQRLSRATSVTRIARSAVSSIEQHPAHVQVGVTTRSPKGISHEQYVSAKLVVAADGAQSTLRHMVNIKARQHNYRQVAIIANVSAQQAHNNIAYERFTDSGPLALLPLSDGRCSMVMTIWREQQDATMAMSDKTFLALLQQRFGQRMGRFYRLGQRSAFPLRLVTAASSGTGRVVLVGNARHYLHPVSGQGFNLAMRDVGSLAALMRQVTDGHIDFDIIASALGRCRDIDHCMTEQFTHTLARLFTVPLAPLAQARGAGLILTDILPWLRHAVARRSMGLHMPLAHG